MNKESLSSPIVVGANCGSGTRVLAEILIKAGINMGYDLNDERDNLIFTYIFKHPHRFANTFNVCVPTNRYLFELHERLFFHRYPKGIKQIGAILSLARDHAKGRYSWWWVRQRLRTFLNQKSVRIASDWGWKEPYNLFHLYGIQDYYPNAKYIHLVRHGLDMAHSKNQQQFHHWDLCFDLDSTNFSPANRFEFWYRSNKYAVETARKLFEKNFLLVKLEDLCEHPEEEISKIFEFIGADERRITDEITAIPRIPSTANRYKKKDTSWITSEIEEKLAYFGYVYEKDDTR